MDGGVHGTMSVPNAQPPTPKPKLRWYQFSLRALLVFATLTAIVLSAAQIPGSRLLVLLVAWLILLIMLMAAGPKAGDGPKRRWTLACCESLAATYGPPFVAAVNTWLFDGPNTWLRADMWKFFLVAPGTINIGLVGMTVWHRYPSLSATVELVSSVLLSAMLLAISAWVAAKTGRARWALLPLMAVWSSWGTLFLDAGMRM